MRAIPLPWKRLTSQAIEAKAHESTRKSPGDLKESTDREADSSRQTDKRSLLGTIDHDSKFTKEHERVLATGKHAPCVVAHRCATKAIHTLLHRSK
jgi:hypothetical protein